MRRSSRFFSRGPPVHRHVLLGGVCAGSRCQQRGLLLVLMGERNVSRFRWITCIDPPPVWKRRVEAGLGMLFGNTNTFTAAKMFFVKRFGCCGNRHALCSTTMPHTGILCWLLYIDTVDSMQRGRYRKQVNIQLNSCCYLQHACNMLSSEGTLQSWESALIQMCGPGQALERERVLTLQKRSGQRML